MKKILSFCLLMLFVFPSLVFSYTLRPQWAPQAQFAGYYMAVHKGFYKEAGIDLEIQNGGPGISGLQEVIDGKIDFATAWLLSALRLRAKGKKPVLIAQFFQKPALMLLAKKSADIKAVTEFSGHTLGVWPGDFQIPPKALLRKYRLKNVEIVSQPFTMEPFLKGDLDIASAMRYNEYIQVLDAGLKPEDLVIFDYADFGLNVPEDGIYVSEEFYNKNQDACKKMAEASIKGWRYAFDHKDETVKLMCELANKTQFKTTPARQKAMLDEVEKLMTLDNISLSEKDFQTAIDALKSTKMIRKGVDYKQFAHTF